MGMAERITVMPDICNGKPVISGTRITVQTVLEFLGAGDSVDDVLAEYPSLSREDVQACIDYAARVMGNHYSVASVK
jgi:uncharacterized protein (DUF433 family)